MNGEFDFSALADLTAGGFDPAQIGVADVAPTPAPGGGFSFWDLASKIGTGARDVGRAIGSGVRGVTEPLADIAKGVLPIAQLGTAGMGIAAGIQGAKTSAANAATQRRAQRMQEAGAAATQAAAAPLTTFGQKQLEAAEQGQIPEAIRVKIANWAQGAKAQAQDYAARSGQGDSQMLVEWLSFIDQKAKEMEAAYLQEQQQLGIQGLTAGAQTLASAGGQAGAVAAGAQNEGQAIAELMRQSNEVLARLSAGAA